MNFHVDIVGLKGKVFEGEIEKVTIPTLDGDMTVMARHMPLVVPLVIGEVIVKTPSETFSLSIGKGFFEFSGGSAKLLIEDVAMADEISEENALAAKKVAEDLLAKGVRGEEKVNIMSQLRRSLVDLKIVRRKKKTPVTTL
jgi:F-type H+-transporting ATPase subunit epsilon